MLLVETEGMLNSLVREGFDVKTILCALKGNSVIELRKLISNIDAALSALPYPTHLLKYRCEERQLKCSVDVL